jgi:hypothetical protein
MKMHPNEDFAASTGWILAGGPALYPFRSISACKIQGHTHASVYLDIALSHLDGQDASASEQSDVSFAADDAGACEVYACLQGKGGWLGAGAKGLPRWRSK